MSTKLSKAPTSNARLKEPAKDSLASQVNIINLTKDLRLTKKKEKQNVGFICLLKDKEFKLFIDID